MGAVPEIRPRHCSGQCPVFHSRLPRLWLRVFSFFDNDGYPPFEVVFARATTLVWGQTGFVALIAIALFLVAFARLPDESGYLIPMVPWVLLIAAVLLPAWRRSSCQPLWWHRHGWRFMVHVRLLKARYGRIIWCANRRTTPRAPSSARCLTEGRQIYYLPGVYRRMMPSDRLRPRLNRRGLIEGVLVSGKR